MAGWYRALNNSLNIKLKLDRVQGSRSDTRLDFCRPGLRYGLSPRRQEVSDRRSWFDRLISRCMAYRERRRYTKVNSSLWLECMSQRTGELNDLTTLQLDANRAALVQKMRHLELSADVLDEAFAHVYVAVERSLGIVVRSNQCLAARAMIDGHCVELATGEGKTLSVALAAGAAALNGTPVHVLTANDYLAERDATYLEPVYQFLGLQVASVVSNQEPAERRHAYTANIVYVTAKQVAFDWLNDALELGSEPDSITVRLAALTRTASRTAYKPMLRGLCLAIVDEADSLLVDEARIPLVLATSQPNGAAEDTEAAVALGLAEQLQEGVDFSILSSTRLIQLTDSGRCNLSRMSKSIAHVWQSSRYREERIEQALTALYRFERDRDYIVRNARLELMDAHTGRAAPDRRLPHGLHTLLELKEKCTTSPQHETIATVPFQRFFRRYIGLVGISGTLDEVAGEIHHVYDRFVVQVPSHRPSLRTDIPAEVFLDRSTQLQAMVKDVQQRQELEQPVLVCTRSVEQSMGVSAMLTAHGLQHQVLNAYQDASEAAIVATAGQAGQITVATNMAGRGTDIPLGEKIAELGGLHVISLAFNDARRLDRQLAGRTARQGDPGSWQQFSSLDDPYLIKAMPPLIRQCAHICVRSGWQRAATMLIYWVQKRMESKHRLERVALYQSRETLERKLAFGGKQEQIS